ncbi:MAG TPA: YkvA family protein [Burkholderiaceae bacterium]|nr:YkvA family protein [Burkholderiaceae bacterium]
MAFARLVRHANRLRLGVHLLALWKLLRHRDTPRMPKLVALLVLAYALSPIDLIPDFIPVLGQLDDLILVPLGIALVVRLTPTALWQARIAEAEASGDALPRVWWGALLVVLVWALLLALFVGWLGAVLVSGVGS